LTSSRSGSAFEVLPRMQMRFRGFRKPSRGSFAIDPQINGFYFG